MAKLSPLTVLEVAVADFRPARPDDAWFIADLLVQGVHAGVFNPRIAEQESLSAVLQQLQFTSECHQLLTPTGWIWSRLFVLEVAGDRKGFIWLADDVTSGPDKALEITAISIVKSYRNMGYGLRLVNSAISFQQKEFPDAALQARCRPAAVQMQSLLRHLGFVSVPDDQAGAMLLRLDPRAGGHGDVRESA
jgi:GNAT superfamily N-acetyltransferase